VSSSPNTEQNNYQNNITSSDSINGNSSTNLIGFLNLNNNNSNNSNDNEPTHTNKRHKAYFEQGHINFPNCLNTSLSVNETPSLNKDLIKHLDQNNNLPTPQIDKLISELNSNAIKTPGSALAILGNNNIYFNSTVSPQIDLSIFDGFTPLITPGSSINPNVLFTAMNNQSSGATSAAAVTAATVLIAPSTLSNHNSSNNTSSINNKYTQLTNVQNNNNNNNNNNNSNINTGNFVLVQTTNGLNGSSAESQDYNILANKTINIKDEKDCLQTVPVHPHNLPNRSNNKVQPPAKSRNNKASTKQTKSASIVNKSDSLNDSSSATPNSSSFNSRRDTGNSTSSSSNLDTSFSPINLDKQETMKLEKKRERNREAARKCRTRKLEKIASLEIQVKNLTETNEMERAKTDKLREEINTIRLKLEQHKKVHNCDLKLNI